MLLDAFEAISDKQSEFARALFEQVILSYPDSKEAERATQELVRLGEPLNQAAAALQSGQSVSQDIKLGTQDDSASREAAPRRVRSIENLRKDFLVATGDRVFFAANSATFGARAKAILENQARWLQQWPEISIQIIGRSDDDVPSDEAVDLSQKRADAVRDQFIVLGIDARRIQAVGRGDRDPVAKCRADDCKPQNRLAETYLVEQNPVTGSRSLSEAGASQDADQDDEPLQRGAAAQGTADDVSRPETIAR